MTVPCRSPASDFLSLRLLHRSGGGIYRVGARLGPGEFVCTVKGLFLGTGRQLVQGSSNFSPFSGVDKEGNIPKILSGGVQKGFLRERKKLFCPSSQMCSGLPCPLTDTEGQKNTETFVPPTFLHTHPNQRPTGACILPNYVNSTKN